MSSLPMQKEEKKMVKKPWELKMHDNIFKKLNRETGKSTYPLFEIENQVYLREKCSKTLDNVN